VCSSDLDAHLETSRFVFGGRPAASDFALYGQLTQLAGFDPTAAAIALESAPRVVAWVDMVEDLSGLEPRDDDWLRRDAIPDTLRALDVVGPIAAFEIFIMRGRDTTNGWQTWWCGWLQSSGVEGSRQFDATQGVLYPYLQGRGVELCPAFSYLSPQLKLKATGASYGYGYNVYLSVPADRPPIKTSKVQRPSETTLFGDAAQVNDFQAPASFENPMLEEWYYLDNPTNYSSANYYPHSHFRHAQKANVAFCDGHVATEVMVPGSLDRRLPSQFVGCLRPEILTLP
jgi:prepilin-type processing-associated H-X9-DG protein